ncbi:hypothetical protein [Alteribacillus iranensis]|uniref:DoxX protein n=1 Tax=Alteribacillus iranensis TaxID=930128 RepID=A0A1I2D4Q0_9BACI|nr:hypothetical protein [Alteribacillus iranensis]SFE75481.1 hypothetical protein SAMN05192532_103408 [Alteribacillus iranensis]
MLNGNRWKRSLQQAVPTTFRLFLAFTFLVYGGAKLTFGQFGIPSEEIAAANGEGFTLAWTFFGYSRLYEIVIGLGEVLAAILLLFPRTATLGAICFLPIATNVMIINYVFDIGVQDLSTLLTAMCLYLLWIDRKKLYFIFMPSDRLEQIRQAERGYTT